MTYDLVVIGSGEGGKYLAWTMARHGWRTALVERRMIGGSCPNVACLPSKNVIHSAKVASLVSRAGEFGIATGPVTLDMERVYRRKQEMVDSLREQNHQHFRNAGVDLILGTARFISREKVAIQSDEGGEVVIAASRIVLSVGSRAAIPDIPGLRAAHPMTHIEALDLRRLPPSVVVIGGGYVALEFAQALSRLGSRVTIIERNERLAHNEDEDVSAALLELLQNEGCEILLNATVIRVSGTSGRGVRLEVRTPDAMLQRESTGLMAAAGRIPNTAGLGLDEVGVRVNERGYIEVDDRLATTAEGIWAVGDCAGTPQFTHAAFDDFRVVRDGFLGRQSSTRGRLIPSCMFTDPEVARIGLNESLARRAGIAYRRFHIASASVLRTRTVSESRGFLKLLVAAESDEILGFTAVSVEASELLAAVQTAMLGRLPYTILRDGIFAHPTMSEGLVFLLAAEPTLVGNTEAA